MGLLGGNKQSGESEKVCMDLGDFVAQKYELKFTINNHQYRFEYDEIQVDEVLSMMFIQQEGETGNDDYRQRVRNRVNDFLKKYIVHGDPKHLEDDLATVPYISRRGSLDINSIFGSIMQRVKKNPTSGETA